MAILVGAVAGVGVGTGAAPSQLPFASSVPQAAITNLTHNSKNEEHEGLDESSYLLAVISLALLDMSTPVGVPVSGKITSGLL